jgi:hypothetical protein
MTYLPFWHKKRIDERTIMDLNDQMMVLQAEKVDTQIFRPQKRC